MFHDEALYFSLRDFYVLLTVHLGTTLGKWPAWCTITLYNSFYYYNLLYVSSNSVLIIRRSNRINTASDIVLSVSDRPVCRFRRNLHTGRSFTENTITDAVLIHLTSWWWAQSYSKHVEDYNNKLLYYVSMHQVGHLVRVVHEYFNLNGAALLKDWKRKIESFITLLNFMLIPVAARSKAWVCGGSFTDTVGFQSYWGRMFV